MQSFWQDLRYAARALRNSPGFTLIAIITLGLGMAVNTTVFSVINGVLLRPLPVLHAEQLTVLAKPSNIQRMVLRQSLLVVGTGLIVGLAAAFAGTRAISSLIVGVRPTDPVTFVTVALLLSLIALVACWIPARRATRVSPLVALRYE
jgi:ABC-type lipoprotein release transport system permease subunit